MIYDRRALKMKAKSLIRTGNPPVYVLTALFLILTQWISTLVSIIPTNPITNAEEIWNAWSSLLPSTGETLSDAQTALMMKQILACFQGIGPSVTLLCVLIVFFYSMVISLGHRSCMLRIMRGETAGYSELFAQLYLASKIIVLQILKFVFMYLWAMLFVVPGVIAFYRYRMAEYALLDDPDISAMEAIRRSKRLMQGHKLELLSTDISFIGWYFVLTLVTNVFYNMVYSFTLQPLLSELVFLITYTVCGMYITTYWHLTYAGYYLHLTVGSAPPVDTANPSQFNSPSDDWN